MGIKKPDLRIFQGISAKLIISFSLIFTVMVFIIGWIDLMGIPFSSSEGRIKEEMEETFTGLSLVADRKKAVLLRWIDERRGDTLVAAMNNFVASSSVILQQKVIEIRKTNEPELWSLVSKDETYLNLVDFLHTIMDTYGYYNKIQIADAETGIVFVSTDNTALGTNLYSEPFFIKTLFAPTVIITDFNLKSENHDPALHFSHQISTDPGGVSGVLVMEVEAMVIMRSIFNTSPFLGESGEMFLVNSNTEVLTPLKYPFIDGSKAKMFHYSIKSIPAILASRGEEGIIEADDYRGKKVLSAYRYISLSADWGWGLVIKTDYDDLFVPLKREIVKSLIIGIVSIVILVVVTILVIQRMLNPVITLKETAERITNGDLSLRAKITSSDELGVMAFAFNHMADSLIDARVGLEEDIRERTKELQAEVLERKRTEKEIRLERDNFFNILAAMEDGVYIVNRELDIQYVNPFLSKEFGSFEGRKCYEYFHNRKTICPLCKINEVFDGKTVHWEWFSEKNGKTYDLLDTPLKNTDGSISKLEIFRDITNRKQVEEELGNHRKHLEDLVEERTSELQNVNKDIRNSQQAMRYLLEDVNEARATLQISNESLERANREMESFSYSVSHDLRSPLRAILGFSSKLEGRIGKDADQETLRLMSVITENTIKMQTLINDILNFSRIGRSELKLEKINMQNLVSETCRNFVEHTEKGNPVFDVQTLPDSYGSYSMIKQVLINLLDNAVKFSRNVDSSSITFGSQISESETVYYVKDNGCGFDMKYSDKIFGIFTRLHNDKGIEGTGVGLAIVKQIIERHGGRVWVESEPGRGTAFYFTLSDINED